MLRYESSETLSNYQLYELISKEKAPVSVADMKKYLGISSSSSTRDVVLSDMINSCVSWGEFYTGREFSANKYSLSIDYFEESIRVLKNPMGVIDKIEYLVLGVLTEVDSSLYYLKRGVQVSEILLKDGMEWPDDIDCQEQAIKISMTTQAVDASKMDIAESTIKRHVAYMFENRGDCSDCDSSAQGAGVKAAYNIIRMPRI